jgi:hypothetical protein
MVAVASSLHELIMVHSRHSQLRYFSIVANCELSVNLATSFDVVLALFPMRAPRERAVVGSRQCQGEVPHVAVVGS